MGFAEPIPDPVPFPEISCSRPAGKFPVPFARERDGTPQERDMVDTPSEEEASYNSSNPVA